ncbi:hypothetical protein ABZX62_00730 [Streptomyces flavidovirens]|uniref:Secreted protein n=1 Tax=Streptomyces flavidovirens TaxID=67298 RepID=A0ABW6RF01_9ACTN
MRRHVLTHGRRGAATGTAAVVLCLGGVLAACGGGSGDDDGYAAVGAAGPGQERAPGRAVPPEGEVELVPLDGDSTPDAGRGGRGGPGDGPPPADGGGGDAGGTGASDGGGGSGSTTEGPPAEGGGSRSGKTDPAKPPGAPGGDEDGSGGGGGSEGGSGGGTSTKPPVTGAPGNGPGTGSGGASPAPPPAPPAGPAVLKLGDPLLAPGDKRWCEQVTVPFRNTGESAVRSGTVTFGTHIIGALGVDWDTRWSTQPLPGPIAAGAAVRKTYTVCVDAWRVPLGMRVETQEVTADWK